MFKALEKQKFTCVNQQQCSTTATIGMFSVYTFKDTPSEPLPFLAILLCITFYFKTLRVLTNIIREMSLIDDSLSQTIKNFLECLLKAMP